MVEEYDVRNSELLGKEFTNILEDSSPEMLAALPVVFIVVTQPLNIG